MVDAEVRQQGYLGKVSSGAFKRQQSRYFVAVGHYLKYYESSEQCGAGEDAKAVLDLRGVLSVEADGDGTYEGQAFVAERQEPTSQ